MEPDLYEKSPYFIAQKILSGKWTLLILYLLSEGPLRFNELQRRLPTMTQTTLARQLKNLEDRGLLLRKVYCQIPPKVEYSLSEIGWKFKNIQAELEKWGSSYLEYIDRNKS